jgi:hypothetical protein
MAALGMVVCFEVTQVCNRLDGSYRRLISSSSQADPSAEAWFLKLPKQDISAVRGVTLLGFESSQQIWTKHGTGAHTLLVA